MQMKTSCQPTITCSSGHSETRAGNRRSPAAPRGRRPCRAGRAGPAARAGRRSRRSRGARRRSRRRLRRRRPGGRQGGQDARVERDVDHRAPAPARERDLVRPRRQADGPRAQPVEHSPDRRDVAGRQRQRARAEPEDLPEHRPGDHLLKDDRLEPPVLDVAEPPDPRRRRRDHERRPEHEDDELHDVDAVDRAGRAEPVDRPVLDDRLQAREEGLGLPLLEVERRRGGLEEPHRAGPYGNGRSSSSAARAGGRRPPRRACRPAHRRRSGRRSARRPC